MKATPKKYYLVTYTLHLTKGTAIHPHRSKMYEFDEDDSPLECYDRINSNLNKEGQVDDVFNAYRCQITNMVRVE